MSSLALRVTCLSLLLHGIAAAQGSDAVERSPSADERAFWAFVPPREPEVPAVRDGSWPLGSLDRFILAALEAKGLRPRPPADKRTLVRRVFFDLTGLPPDPDEVDRFTDDDSLATFAKLVDKLLASPRYGERWGRHWLDVARYADSNGMDENLAYANAYRYRDYVIAALNADKPYDQFVREQIAGDLLPVPGNAALTNERIVATGFLSLGPKMLAEDDPVKMEMDIVDEQVDTVGRTFLGLTLGCARCHDHKFDPFTMQDYYGLAGIFKSTRTMENFKVVARWHERPIGSPEAVERKIAIEREAAAKRSEADGLLVKAMDLLKAEALLKAAEYARAGEMFRRRAAAIAGLKPAMESPDSVAARGAIVLEAENYARGNVKKDFTDYGNPIGVIYNRGELPNVAEYDVVVAHAGPYQLDLRYAAAEARPVEVLLNGEVVHSGAAGRTTGSWTPETQAWEVTDVMSLREGKNTLRLERAGPFPHFDKLALTPCAPEVPDSLAAFTAKAAIKEGLNGNLLQLWLESLEKAGAPPNAATAESFADALSSARGFLSAPSEARERCLPEADLAQIRALREEVDRLVKSAPVLPDAMAVTEGTPQNVRLHVRGSHWDLGPEVLRRLPRVLEQGEKTSCSPSQSGRLELAHWLVEPGHPLTSRVIVNRLWRWHFGEGIVGSTDNFGRLGDRPTHPELLDWLALRLVESGWSLKALHRLIVLSATYQMSALDDADAAAVDPENRFHWRSSRRRLEAESIRDTILRVSGGLDLTMGGTLLKSKNREYVASTASTNGTSYSSLRRSVYLPIVRSALYEVFQAFDFADPSTPNGDRDTTTVASQALFFMSSDLMRAESKRFGARLEATGLGDEDKVKAAYRLAYSRRPTEEEAAEALEFLDRYSTQAEDVAQDLAERRKKAWEAFAQAILSASELTHVD